MKVALTGATGRVGSRLLPRLLGRGDTVRALIRDPAAAEQVAGRGAEPVLGDLSDPAALSTLTKDVDAVLHVAALLRTTDEQQINAVNVDGTRQLADAAEAAGVPRFVFTSTNLVYPSGLGRPATEDDAADPDPAWGAYPRSKVIAERNLLSRDGLDVTVVRLAFVYGDGDPHLRESLRWAAQWPGHQRLQLLHHADAAMALFRALDAPGVSRRVFNAADYAPISAVELHQLAGVEPPPTEIAKSDTDPWHGIVSTSRIRTELGFRPLYPSAYAAQDAGAL